MSTDRTADVSVKRVFTEELRKAIHHRYFNNISTFLFVVLYLNFLYNHVTAIKAGAVSPFVFVVVGMEATVILVLLLRTNPVVRSTEALAWVFALAGTFMPILLLPFNAVTVNAAIGNTMMVLGGLCAIASYLSLNNSHGTTPALRQVKTKGMYKLIRHPMYFSYFVIFTGYLFLVFSPYNLVIVGALFVSLLVRIFYEEKLLSQSPDYQAFKERTKYRLIPYLF